MAYDAAICISFLHGISEFFVLSYSWQLSDHRSVKWLARMMSPARGWRELNVEESGKWSRLDDTLPLCFDKLASGCFKTETSP